MKFILFFLFLTVTQNTFAKTKYKLKFDLIVGHEKVIHPIIILEENKEGIIKSTTFSDSSQTIIKVKPNTAILNGTKGIKLFFHISRLEKNIPEKKIADPVLFVAENQPAQMNSTDEYGKIVFDLSVVVQKIK